MSQYIDMPRLGLGTWQLEGQKASDTVAQAIQLGYRHIDTATRYDNEAAVGKGLQQSRILALLFSNLSDLVLNSLFVG